MTQKKADKQAEEALISRIQAIIESHRHADTREGGFYFDAGCVAPFNRAAADIALLIKKQGAENTASALVEVAREIQAECRIFGDSFLENHNIGYSFVKAFEKTGTPITKKGPTNPFKGMNL